MKTFLITKQVFTAAAISSALVLYFTFYALFGDKGVVKYFQLKKELQNKEFVKEGLENKMENKKTTSWKNSYTWVLVINAIYIIIFFVLMQLFF